MKRKKSKRDKEKLKDVAMYAVLGSIVLGLVLLCILASPAALVIGQILLFILVVAAGSVASFGVIYSLCWTFERVRDKVNNFRFRKSKQRHKNITQAVMNNYPE